MSLTLTLSRGRGTMTGYGTDITLNGTGDGQLLSVDLYGDTQQQTYTGKNLLNLGSNSGVSNGVNYSITNDGRLLLDGPCTSDRVIIPIASNSLSGTYTFTQNSGYSVALRESSSVTTNLIITDSSSTGTINGTAAYIFIFGLSGVSFNNKKVELQIESGSFSTSFEPYVGGTASPNPDYPQDVQVVKGLQTVTISDGGSQTQTYQIDLEGKNKFSTVIEQGSIDASTGDIANNKRARSKGFVDVLPNTEYTFNITNNLGSPSLGIAFAYDKNGNYVTQYPSSGWSSMPLTFTTGATIEKIRVVLKTQNESVVSGSNFSNVQLELGGSATAYVAYRAIELCKIGNYQDYIYKSGDDWYVHKATIAFQLNGSIGGFASEYNWYYQSLSSLGITNVGGQGIFCFCSFFTPYNYSTLRSGSYPGIAQSSTNLVIRNVNCTDAATYKTWMGKFLPKIYYPLATATDTLITDATLISQLDALAGGHSYSGTTVITVNGNLKSPLEVSASTAVTKTYTEAELGVPLTIADVEGKSQTTTLDGNIFVDWAYNKKQFSVDLFNLTPIDYAEIRSFYEYQFLSSEFPTITIPELNITDMPVFMEMSTRNIVNKCLLTDKITLKFRETIQP